jgi:hypothetical protein
MLLNIGGMVLTPFSSKNISPADTTTWRIDPYYKDENGPWKGLGSMVLTAVKNILGMRIYEGYTAKHLFFPRSKRHPASEFTGLEIYNTNVKYQILGIKEDSRNSEIAWLRFIPEHILPHPNPEKFSDDKIEKGDILSFEGYPYSRVDLHNTKDWHLQIFTNQKVNTVTERNNLIELRSQYDGSYFYSQQGIPGISGGPVKKNNLLAAIVEGAAPKKGESLISVLESYAPKLVIDNHIMHDWQVLDESTDWPISLLMYPRYPRLHYSFFTKSNFK